MTLKIALAALSACLLMAAPVRAQDVPSPFDNGQRLCESPLAPCIRTAQDFTVADFVRLMQKANPSSYLNTSSALRLIEANEWEGVEEGDIIPAGTQVRL